MNPRSTTMIALIGAAIAVVATSVGADADQRSWPTMQQAAQLTNATMAPLLAAAVAGHRLVAVGDHGVVLLSDDGRSFRQAKAVPTNTMLTTVQFLDQQHGFAGGHDGVVLRTDDGGETWALLRATPGAEQPILSLHFDSPEHGMAVGLYGWAIETGDGGHTWHDVHIGSGDDADRHLFYVFASGSGALLIAGEAGTIFRSVDGGKSWQAQSTGNKGSLWYGSALADGTLLLCGMRGHLYRSGDDGMTWQSVATNTTESLTGIAERPDGTVIVVGMGGTMLRSNDRGRSFTLTLTRGREPLTGVVADGPRLLLLSMTGVLPEADAAPR